MQNELIVKGIKEIEGKKIKIIEGGFGSCQKCILASDIAKQHEVETKYINQCINRELSRFTNNDLVDLKTGCSKELVLSMGFTPAQYGNAKNIFLLSERGYTKLVSMMSNDNEKKWEVMDRVIDEYFTMRDIINSDEQLKAQLLLQIYNGGIESIEASKQLIAIEKKPLINKIEEQKPKVDYCEKVLNAENQKVYTITEIAKKYDMTGKELNQILYNEGIQFKNNGTWLLYSQHTGKGYVQHFTKVKVEYGNERTIYEHMKWTQKGRMMIHELLKECRYI